MTQDRTPGKSTGFPDDRLTTPPPIMLPSTQSGDFTCKVDASTTDANIDTNETAPTLDICHEDPYGPTTPKGGSETGSPPTMAWTISRTTGRTSPSTRMSRTASAPSSPLGFS